MDKLFKFELGDVVVARRHAGHEVLEGKITIRMNLASGNRYEYRPADGLCKVEDERDLILAEHRPSWLKKGAKVRWLGEGRNLVYVVTSVNRRYRGMPAGMPTSFDAERDLKDKLGRPVGKEVIHSSCGARDIPYWERYQEPKAKVKKAAVSR
jgi:hypothetical protein